MCWFWWSTGRIWNFFFGIFPALLPPHPSWCFSWSCLIPKNLQGVGAGSSWTTEITGSSLRKFSAVKIKLNTRFFIPSLLRATNLFFFFFVLNPSDFYMFKVLGCWIVEYPEGRYRDHWIKFWPCSGRPQNSQIPTISFTDDHWGRISNFCPKFLFLTNF